MGGQKKKPLGQQKHSKPTAKSSKKTDKQENKPSKTTIPVKMPDKQALRIIQTSKVITAHDLAKQTGVRISTTNAFLKRLLAEGTIKEVSRRSGHCIYQPATS